MEKWVIVILIGLGSFMVFEMGIIFGLMIPSMVFVPAKINPIQQETILENGNAVLNISITNELVRNYYDTHQAYEYIYDCDQMAGDFWDQAKARGLTARLVIGTYMKNLTLPSDIDHAWVIVMISDDKWVAVDPTLGSLQFYELSPRYYYGIVFENPARMQDYLYHYTPGGEPSFTRINPVLEGPYS
jgi:hypothetical protein